MATISFDITTQNATRLVDAFGHDYQATIDGQPNPQTKAQHARLKMLEYIKNYVTNYERSQQSVTKIELT